MARDRARDPFRLRRRKRLVEGKAPGAVVLDNYPVPTSLGVSNGHLAAVSTNHVKEVFRAPTSHEVNDEVRLSGGACRDNERATPPEPNSDDPRPAASNRDEAPQ